MAKRNYKEFKIKHLTSYLSPVTDILAIQHIDTMKYLYIVIIALVLGCSSKQRSCIIDNQWQRIDTTYYLKNGYLLHEFTSDEMALLESGMPVFCDNFVSKKGNKFKAKVRYGKKEDGRMGMIMTFDD